MSDEQIKDYIIDMITMATDEQHDIAADCVGSMESRKAIIEAVVAFVKAA